MRTLFIAIISLYLSISLYGQEIQIQGIYGSSSFDSYNTNAGYAVAFNKIIKSKNRIGLSLSHSYSKSAFDKIEISSTDGLLYKKIIKPNNQRIAFKAHYAFKLINNPKSGLFLGPILGLNYFVIDEQIHEIGNENTADKSYIYSYTYKNKIGIGIVLDFELHEFIHPNLSLFSSITPEITFLYRHAIKGIDDPSMIRSMQSNVGFRYKINKS